MMEAVGKLENSPSVTSAQKLPSTAQFDVDVTASKSCAPGYILLCRHATSDEHQQPGGTSKAQTCTTISRGNFVRFEPMQCGAGRNTYLVNEPVRTPWKDSGMQHLTSVRYTSCTASLMLEDKASCALAATVSKVKLHVLPSFAARVKDVQ